MNFLSHYYLFKESQDAHFIFGTVLPDLSRNFEKKFKIHGLDPIPENLKGDALSIANGVQTHIDTDKVFHNAEFFKLHTDEFENYLNETPFENFNKHYYFFAHITFELMLDRLIIQTERKVIDDFYALLTDVKKEVIAGYFAEEEAEEKTDAFYEYYLDFLEKQYLYRYESNDGMLYALNRVYSKVTKAPLSDHDKGLLDESLTLYENYLLPFLQPIMLGVKEGLNEFQ